MVLMLVSSIAGRVSAQEGSTAGLFLVAPIGARLVAIGGAGVADPTGSSAFLANPAGFGRLARGEVSFDFGQDEVTTRYVLVGALPISVLGTIAVDAYLSDAGGTDVTGRNNVLYGHLTFRDVAAGASYGARFGKRLNVGLTYKVVQRRQDCTSGTCINPDDPALGGERSSSTSAVDFGAQYDLGARNAVHLGAAILNLGPRLQTRDEPQSDPLPTRLAIGGSYDVPRVEQYVPGAALRILTETTIGFGAEPEHTYQIGTEATYRQLFSLRAGYNQQQQSGYSGLTFGFGLQSRRFRLDIAQQIAVSGLNVDKPPTYVGLRYSF